MALMHAEKPRICLLDAIIDSCATLLQAEALIVVGVCPARRMSKPSKGFLDQCSDFDFDSPDTTALTKAVQALTFAVQPL